MRLILTISFVLSIVQVSLAADRPNIVLMMADDLGWGDVGFNGGQIIQTPNLDAMAAGGMKFNRFYAAAPVCSPTRGSCLTGRHPYRYGIYHANVGHMKPPERTLAELLKELGYTTGHFGKWHLGTFSLDYSPRGQKRKPKQNYSPPNRNGFDEWFSTEHAVATWNPYDPANKHGPFKWDARNMYWHNGRAVTEGLQGDDSRIIMDKAIPFIRGAVASKKPFFTVVWFHAPHSPVVGGPEYRKQYAEYDENHQHYYACVTALDEQVGRLRKELRDLGVAENTMVCFNSDNGPARQGRPRHVGSPGPFRGFKTMLFEGGVRVPGVVEWPGMIEPGQSTGFPAVTSDYLPTILEVLGIPTPDDRPLDGISLVPVIEGHLKMRPKPICFQSRKQLALTDNRYKLLSRDGGKTWMLFDLLADPSEKNDLADENADVVERMKETLAQWRDSCQHSDAGEDYPKPIFDLPLNSLPRR